MLSLVAAAEGRHVLSALLFAALLNAKHIFLYAAPPFFVYLLRRHCRGPPLAAAVGRFLGLGAAVVGVTAASLGPFVAAGQLAQLAGRLFPFARGLCHAYWAPNVWALYAGVDKVLALALGRRGAGGGATMTGTEFEWAGRRVGAAHHNVVCYCSRVPQPYASAPRVLCCSVLCCCRRPGGCRGVCCTAAGGQRRHRAVDAGGNGALPGLPLVSALPAGWSCCSEI